MIQQLNSTKKNRHYFLQLWKSNTQNSSFAKKNLKFVEINRWSESEVLESARQFLCRVFSCNYFIWKIWRSAGEFPSEFFHSVCWLKWKWKLFSVPIKWRLNIDHLGLSQYWLLRRKSILLNKILNSSKKSDINSI
jgi:hypothetical protein